MYLNSFLFDLGYANYQEMITWTEALSAITACITTIIMGGLSDKVGKRKIFITFGYLLWGVSTALFGLINSGNVKSLFPAVASAQIASIFVIAIDCLMTFFGSTANDASFNAYVTRNVTDKNRGKVEGVLSILPLMSMLAITVIFTFTAEANGEWDIFFFIIGAFVFLVGILSFFLIPKEKTDPKEEKYIRLVFEGFKPHGLSDEEVLKRQATYGKNKLKEKKKKSWFRIFIEQLNNPMIFVLFAAIAVTIGLSIYDTVTVIAAGNQFDFFTTGDWPDVIIILAVILMKY